MTTPKMYYRMRIPELLDDLDEDECKLVYDVLRCTVEEAVTFKEAAEIVLGQLHSEEQVDAIE